MGDTNFGFSTFLLLMDNFFKDFYVPKTLLKIQSSSFLVIKMFISRIIVLKKVIKKYKTHFI